MLVGPVTLDGWKLTLPVVGRKGDAATVNPAAVSPPWLQADRHGGLTLWAPVAGATTPNSGHTRTELDSLTPFLAGVGKHVLTASVTVAQLPRAKPDVIIGQIHGSDAISSVPFVMLLSRQATTSRPTPRPAARARHGRGRRPRDVPRPHHRTLSRC